MTELQKGFEKENTGYSNFNKENHRQDLLVYLLQNFKYRFDTENDLPLLYRDECIRIAEEINKYYWNFIFFVKGEKYVIKTKNSDENTLLSIYKIISATELSVIKSQPIVDNRYLNAELASFIAMYFYKVWYDNEYDLGKIAFEKNELQQVWLKFLKDRVTWLTNVNTAVEFPFFLNSQVWMLIDMLTRNVLQQNLK